MSAFSDAIVDKLASDYELVAMLPQYDGRPTIFTVDPAPEDSPSPHIVTAGEVVSLPWDTKTTRGRDIVKDVRVYAPAEGSAVTVEAIAERVRSVLHRQPLTINGFLWVISNVSGPIVIDEVGYYGRVLSLNMKAQEE